MPHSWRFSTTIKGTYFCSFTVLKWNCVDCKWITCIFSGVSTSCIDSQSLLRRCSLNPAQSLCTMLDWYQEGICLIWPKKKKKNPSEHKSLWDARWSSSFCYLVLLAQWAASPPPSPRSWFHSWAQVTVWVEFLYPIVSIDTLFLYSCDMKPAPHRYHSRTVLVCPSILFMDKTKPRFLCQHN